jgi:hypothetical protein
MMTALAESFASDHRALDFSVGSLTAFEQLVAAAAKQVHTEALVLRWGAYLGEVIRRASGNRVVWEDFDAAVGRAPNVASVGKAAETAWVLRAGTTCWFPLVKVNKFIANGASDSPAAFASVVIGVLAADGQSDRDLVEAPRISAARESVSAFFAMPSSQSLWALAQASWWMGVKEFVQLVAEAHATPASFYPFFGQPPEGTGRQRRDVGRIAARQVARLIEGQLSSFSDEAANIDARMTSGDKRTRGNAAYVLGRWHCARGDPTVSFRAYVAGDAAIRAGLLEALAFVLNDEAMGRTKQRNPAEFAPMLVAALRGKTDERSAALRLVRQITGRLSGDITTMIDPLLEILDEGKPEQIECALQALTGHAFSVLHGRCAYDPRLGLSILQVVRHAAALSGKVKVTKVQIAASYALGAYATIAQHFDADQRAAVDKGRAATTNIR